MELIQSYITLRSNRNFRQGFVGLILTNSIFFCEIAASCYLAPNITVSNLLNLYIGQNIYYYYYFQILACICMFNKINGPNWVRSGLTNPAHLKPIFYFVRPDPTRSVLLKPNPTCSRPVAQA